MSLFPGSLVHPAWIAPRKAMSLGGQEGDTAQYAPLVWAVRPWSCPPGLEGGWSPWTWRQGCIILSAGHGARALGLEWVRPERCPFTFMDRAGVVASLSFVMPALGFRLWHCLCLSAVPSRKVRGHGCLLVLIEFPGERAQVYLHTAGEVSEKH